MNRRASIGILVAVLIALVLRCPDLSVRPMHNDEAVNAVKLGSLMGPDGYRYDPNEHHGPALYYFALAWTQLSGTTKFPELGETQLRGLTVLFGVALILLLPLVADGLGRGAMVCAALLLAISPAMVFYSRYFIHEMLLVFFTFLALAAYWRYYRDGKIFWALIGGGAVGLMQSTKETFVLSLAAFAVAWGLNRQWTHSSVPGRTRLRKALKPVVIGVLAWLVVVVVFFTSFFSNAGGLLDCIRTYHPWLARAAGASPHVHPWDFYLSRLTWYHVPGGPVWSEGLILVLALLGALACFRGRGMADARLNFLRFVFFYTVTLGGIYSLIAYKTPWCLLNFWPGVILLAGVGVMAIWQFVHNGWGRIALGTLLAVGAGQLAVQAWRTAGIYSADRRNPYVYAQTSRDILELTGTISTLAKNFPPKGPLVINVCVPENDYWPLPWYLRTYDQVGWFSQLPADPAAAVLIVAPEFAVRLDGQKTHHEAGLFELRPGVFLALYVRQEFWQAFLESRKKPGD